MHPVSWISILIRSFRLVGFSSSSWSYSELNLLDLQLSQANPQLQCCSVPVRPDHLCSLGELQMVRWFPVHSFIYLKKSSQHSAKSISICGKCGTYKHTCVFHGAPFLVPESRTSTKHRLAFSSDYHHLCPKNILLAYQNRLLSVYLLALHNMKLKPYQESKASIMCRSARLFSQCTYPLWKLSDIPRLCIICAYRFLNLHTLD